MKAFEAYQVEFPMLVVRNSLSIVLARYQHRIDQYGLSLKEWFQPLHVWQNLFVEQKSELFQELNTLKQKLQVHFEEVEKIATQTDAVFGQMLQAQKAKQLNGYEKLYQRLIKAEKQKEDKAIKKLTELHSYLFPRGNWQERVINFSVFYTQWGSTFFEEVYRAISPFDAKFSVVEV